MLKFRAELHPDEQELKQCAALDGLNPYMAPACVKAFAKAYNYQLALLGLEEEDRMKVWCPAFLSRGRLNTRLHMNTLPVLNSPRPFWTGLEKFCREQDIASLAVYSFGCYRNLQIGQIAGQTHRSSRKEYIVNLKRDNLWPRRKGHRYNIKRCWKENVGYKTSGHLADYDSHVGLRMDSKARRTRRGERLTGDFCIEEEKEMLRSGAAALFQAVSAEGEVLSSYLVAMAEKGAYLISGGSSPQGIRIGASCFLIYAIEENLREQGKELLNMGTANEDNTGLIKFKLGFGAEPVELEQAEFFLGSPLKKWVSDGFYWLKGSVRGLRG